MLEVRQSEVFAHWFAHLPDAIAKRRIAQRVVRLQSGLFGDAKSVGGGIADLRVDHEPGYRHYFVRTRETTILLLWGGDKSTQRRDIARAKALTSEL